MYFYLPNLNTKIISKDYSGHFFAMRVKVGDQVKITDFKGTLQTVKVTFVDKKSKVIVFEILGSCNVPKPPPKILFQAIPDKNYLEKIMEIIPFSSFTRIVLFKSHNSPKYLPDINRLNRIIIRSSQLAQKTWSIEIEAVVSLDKLAQEIKHANALVLNPNKENNCLTGDFSCIVGPEGGWSKAEIEYFESLGLQFASIGDMIYPSWLAGYSFDIMTRPNKINTKTFLN